MKNWKSKIGKLLLSVFIFLFASFVNLKTVFAQVPSDLICTPSRGSNIGFNTAIGCIPAGGGQVFIEFLLTWGVGIGGGVGFILIVYAGFMIITSGGNPQKLQAGKELLTAAIMGLILLVFGVWLLRLIGFEILNIPGFGN